MILAALRDLLEAGERPSRDLVIAFFADEENGGVFGSHYLVDHHPELFAGATEAISEVGGYSIHVGGRRAYLLQTGEKALVWVRLDGPRRRGARLPRHRRQRGHEARRGRRDARPPRVAGAADHDHDRRCSPSSPACSTSSPGEIRTSSSCSTGTASGFLRAILRTTSNPTVLEAGYKHNVIPDRAEALVDIRPFAGEEDAVLARVRELVGPEIEVEIVHHDIGLETPFEGRLVDDMIAALGRHDPGAPVLPYLMSGGTDNKALAELGITGYGFAPLASRARTRLPGHVPRGRRAGAARRARLRTRGARRPAAQLLTRLLTESSLVGLLEAIILGLVQGLTEFLPISSSAHLRILGEVAGWGDPGATFTAITQLGTETAVHHLLPPRHRRGSSRSGSARSDRAAGGVRPASRRATRMCGWGGSSSWARSRSCWSATSPRTTSDRRSGRSGWSRSCSSCSASCSDSPTGSAARTRTSPS